LEDINISGARGLLINITGGKNLTLHEASEASNAIFEAAGKEANVIFGMVVDEKLTDEVKITVIATGFEQKKKIPANESLHYPSSQRLRLEDLVRPSERERDGLRRPPAYAPATPEAQDQECDLDIPTFLRRKAGVK
jgi:cell division protein FtsZ